MKYTEVQGLTLLHIPHKGEVVRGEISILLRERHIENQVLLSFFAHMLMRGTKKKTKETLEAALDEKGIDLTFGSQDGILTIRFTTQKEYVATTYALLLEILTMPAWHAKEMVVLKKEYLEAYKEEDNDTRFLALQSFIRTIYSKDEPPYIPDRKARIELLKKITKQTLIKAHKEIPSAHIVASLFGDQKAYGDLVAMLKKIHRGHTQNAPTVLKPHVAKSTTIATAVPGKQNIELFIGNRIPITTEDPRFVPLSFGVDVLGKRGGFAGRLMSTVREKEGLTYSIYAWLKGITRTTYGHFSIWTFFTAADIKKGITSTKRELTHLIKNGITEEELIRFKELLKNQWRLAHESHSGTLSLYHTALVQGHTPEILKEMVARVQTLTKEEVNSALQDLIDPEKLIIAGAGPTKGVLEKK